MNKKISPQVGLSPTSPRGQPREGRRRPAVRSRKTAENLALNDPSLGRTPISPDSVALAHRYLAAVELSATETQHTLFAALTEHARDVLLVAPTGSGKTFAACLPLMAALLCRATYEPGVKLLIVAPTRAIVEQHRDTCAHLATALSRLAAKDFVLTVAARTGDTPQSERTKQRVRPADVLIVTPESLQIMLATDAKGMLLTVESLVLDEVHQLCSGRRGALLSVVLSLLDWTRSRVGLAAHARRIALTATAHPEAQLARWIGTQTSVCRAGSARVSEIELLVPEAQQWFPEPGHNARKLLPMLARKIAQNAGTSLFFVSSRVRAEAWTQALRDVLPSAMPVRCFHSSMSKDQRGLVAQELHRGELRAVVSTSALEAGVDVASAEQVLFLGSPHSVTQTLQSTGRSRHRPGASGVAAIACVNISDAFDALAIKHCVNRAQIEAVELTRDDHAVLVQAVLAIVSCGPVDVQSITDILRRSYAFESVSDDTLAAVIDHLRTGGEALAAYDQTHRIAATDTGYTFASAAALKSYLRACGTIVDDPMCTVVFGSKTIGKIDGRFAAGLQIGDRFTLAGSTWKVLQLFDTQLSVALDPQRGPIAEWNGSRATHSPLLTQTLSELYDTLSTHVADGAQPAQLAASLDCPLSLATALRDWGLAQRACSAIPSAKLQLVECIEGRAKHTLVLYTFAGTNSNDAIARVAAERWRMITHAGCEFAASDLGLVLTLPRRTQLDASNWQEVKVLFGVTDFQTHLRQTLDDSVLARSVFRDIARVAQLSTQEHRPGGASPHLLYNVLRKHAPSHLLMRALDRALWQLLGGETAVKSLESLQARCKFVRCSHISPMAISLVARTQRTDRRAPDDLDTALATVAHRLWISSGATELP
jgi:ATP-dependent Lhr-like helicase